MLGGLGLGSDDVFTCPEGWVRRSDDVFTCLGGWDWGRMMYFNARWVGVGVG